MSSRRSASLGACLAVACLLTSCVTSFASERVRERHAGEYKCAEETVKVDVINEKTYRATGCGVEVIYVCPDGMTCVRDSPPR